MAMSILSHEMRFSPSQILLLLSVYAKAYKASPDIHVKVVLVPCQAGKASSGTDSTVDAFLSAKPTLTDCQKKLGIVLRINNNQEFLDEDMYVFLDEAMDQVNGVMEKLTEPIVLKIYQYPVSLGHAFHYLGSLNGKLAEVVYTAANLSSKDSLTACFSNELSHFQCGYDSNEKFPKGFCCPCTSDECDPYARERSCKQAEENPTTHCLKESPYWYFVTALGPPVIYHTLEIHMYQRNHSGSWQAITRKPGILLTTDMPTTTNKEGFVVAKYLSSVESSSIQNGLPYDTHRLLIPHYLPGLSMDGLPPHMANGARDYMLVPTSMLQLDDTRCGKLGSYFRSFWNQEQRCQRPVGSCLELQPLDLWSQDNERRENGQEGQYLLENFANPQEDAIVVNTRNSKRYLSLEYTGQHHSMSFIEINADGMQFDTASHKGAMVGVNTLAMVNPIVIQLHVANTHHRPGFYRAYIKGCSFGFSSTSTDDVYLAPQEKHILLLSLRMDAGMPTTDVWCNVVLETERHISVATRSVLIRPRGRCQCYADCQCTCLGESMACRPGASVTRNKRRTSWHLADKPTEPLHHYEIPDPFVMSSDEAPADTTNTVACTLSTLLWALQVFIVIGFVKAMLGLVCPSIAMWGLKGLAKHSEEDLFQAKDVAKAASHGQERGSVKSFGKDDRRPVSTAAVFCMNVFCFCLLPCIVYSIMEKRKDGHHADEAEGMKRPARSNRSKEITSNRRWRADHQPVYIT